MANQSKHSKPPVEQKQIVVQSSILPQSSTTSNLTKESQVGAVSWDNRRNKPIKKTELFINDCKFAHFIFSVSTLKPRFLILRYFSVILTSGPVWYCGVRGREPWRGKKREKQERGIIVRAISPACVIDHDTHTRAESIFCRGST